MCTAHKVWGKVIFSLACVKNSVHIGGGWYPSMHCRWYPSMPCRSPGGWYPSMPCRSQGPHLGGVSRPTPWGVSQHALRQTPQQMATAVGSMHPTGMHSCFTGVCLSTGGGGMHSCFIVQFLQMYILFIFLNIKSIFQNQLQINFRWALFEVYSKNTWTAQSSLQSTVFNPPDFGRSLDWIFQLLVLQLILIVKVVNQFLDTVLKCVCVFVQVFFWDFICAIDFDCEIVTQFLDIGCFNLFHNHRNHVKYF